MDWAVRLLAAGALLLWLSVGSVAALTISAHNQEELIAGIRDPKVSDIVLEQDVSLYTEHWQELLIERNLTISGANRTAADASSARLVRLNLGYLYNGFKLAPNVTFTFQDLELRDFSYVPRPAKDFMAPAANATLKWYRVWQHWRAFPKYEDFAAEAMKVSMKWAPSGYSGKPMIIAVNKTECQQRYAWPAACADEGMFTGLHAIAVPLKTELNGPLDTSIEGGYTWICQDCYLSTDEFGSEACIRSKGFKQCFENLNENARARELAAGKGLGEVNIAAVVVGAVVGGLLLAALAGGLLLLWWRRKHRMEKTQRSFTQSLVPSEYVHISVVEGSQYPSGLVPIIPRASPPEGLPLGLQSGLAIGNLVGIGSFGMVHKGLFNGRPVALKLLMHNHPETISRVHQEVQITAGVHHDNVAATYCCLLLDKGVLMACGKASIAQVAKDGYSTNQTPPVNLHPAYSLPTSDGSNPVFVNVANSHNLPRLAAMDGSRPSNPGLRPSGSIGNVKFGDPLTSLSMMRTLTSSEESSGMVARTHSRPIGMVCLVLEYCAGGSLLDAQEAGVLLGLGGMVDLNVLWPLLMDVARGMAALHAMGVCHGDLKSDNCMLSKALQGHCTCKCHGSSSAPPSPASTSQDATAVVGSCTDSEAADPRDLGARRSQPTSGLEPIKERHSHEVLCPVSAAGGAAPAAAAAGAHQVWLGVLAEGDVEQGGAPTIPAGAPEVAAKASRTGPASGLSGPKPCCGQCRPHAKITDFGLVRALSPLATHVSTKSHGTVTHMPPEVLMEGHLRPAADVYSYGIMAYELVTGRRAWEGYTYPQIVRMVGIDGARPPLPAALPQVIQQLIHSCWAADPRERATFEQLLQILSTAWDRGVVSKLQQDMLAEIASVSGFL